MKFSHSIILNSDSYKYSQWVQYPPGTEYIYSYIESRGGEYDQLVFLGLQAFRRAYLSHPITSEMVEYAKTVIESHGEPFNYDDWMYIVNTHGGWLPVEIHSVDEGSVMNLKNVLVTIVNTDPRCYWLTSFLETALLRAIWYPTTVASNSYVSRQIIRSFLEKNGDPSGLNFKLHDFGARGVSTFESAAIGGMAHLATGALGTDTVSALLAAREFYDADIASGFSIPAMEHSTVTSWGRENEAKAYENMLKRYAKPNSLVAFVSDSYDIYNACDRIWGQELRDKVVESGATVIIRPDSGDPVEVVNKCLQILDRHFGHTVNEKGYRVLNHVRIIQGDGINHQTIRAILTVMDINGYSADNVAFGQGGALLQQVNRDTLQFAMKCSAAYVDGKWIDVYKDPITSKSKKSKRGRFKLIVNQQGKFETVAQDYNPQVEDHLKLRFRDGRAYNETTFDQIRERAQLPVR